MPITIFSLSIAGCVDCLTLLTRRSARLSSLHVEVHHPLTDDISGDINSTGISHLFSQLISDDEHLDFIHFVYAQCYLLSIRLLQNVQTISHSWEDVQQSQASFDLHHPLADNVSGHVNSPGTPHLFS